MRPRQAHTGTQHRYPAAHHRHTHTAADNTGHHAASNHAAHEPADSARTHQHRIARGLIVLEMLCYLIAFVLLAHAAVLPQTFPYRDRLAYAGLAAAFLPLLVHAVQAH